MFRHRILIAFIWLVPCLTLAQGRIISLWPNDVPFTGTDGQEIRKDDELLWITNVQEPTLEVFLPTKRSANGQGIIICPGGGYQGLAYDWEGTDVAKFLNANGIAGFVLKYRLPGKVPTSQYNAPLADARRAVRLVRNNAKSYNLEETKIGIMGFSAGGHLASTLGTHVQPDYEAVDEIDSGNGQPDFMILIYPVITMQDPYVHHGSRTALLGNEPTTELLELYSNQLQVTEETPYTFLIHAGDDEGVPVENSIQFHKRLIQSGVPVEMHIYPRGSHGFGLATGMPSLSGWTDLLIDWLGRFGARRVAR